MVWYNRGKTLILNPSSATDEAPMLLLSDVIAVALMLNAYTINIDTHVDFGDIATSEIANSGVDGYVARGDGRELASKAVAVDDANDRAEFDAADLTFPAIGGTTDATFNQIVIFRQPDASQTNDNAELLAHASVNATTTNGGDITLVWNAQGILQITA